MRWLPVVDRSTPSCLVGARDRPKITMELNGTPNHRVRWCADTAHTKRFATQSSTRWRYYMRIRKIGRNILVTAFLIIAAQFLPPDQPHAQAQPVSIFIVRHSETDGSLPALPADGSRATESGVIGSDGTRRKVHAHLREPHHSCSPDGRSHCVSARPRGDPIAGARLNPRRATGHRANLTPSPDRADFSSLA
jgi:hypothetical protein